MIDRHGNEYVEFIFTLDDESSLYLIFENGVSKKVQDETLVNYESGDLSNRVPDTCSLIVVGTHDEYKEFLDSRRRYLNNERD